MGPVVNIREKAKAERDKADEDELEELGPRGAQKLPGLEQLDKETAQQTVEGGGAASRDLVRCKNSTDQIAANSRKHIDEKHTQPARKLESTTDTKT